MTRSAVKPMNGEVSMRRSRMWLALLAGLMFAMTAPASAHAGPDDAAKPTPPLPAGHKAKAERRTASIPGVGIQNVILLYNQDGRSEEFWVGSDSALWHRWQLSPGSNSWSDPISLGGVLILREIAGAPNLDGRLEIFAVGPYSHMYHIWQVQPNSGWSDWVSMGGLFNGGPRAFVQGNGRIQVEGRFTGDNCWYQSHQKFNNEWTIWAYSWC
jgi:hypothetical protein